MNIDKKEYAFKAGCRAYRQEQPPSDNPYRDDVICATEWHNGWHAAKDDDERTYDYIEERRSS